MRSRPNMVSEAQQVTATAAREMLQHPANALQQSQYQAVVAAACPPNCQKELSQVVTAADSIVTPNRRERLHTHKAFCDLMAPMVLAGDSKP